MDTRTSDKLTPLGKYLLEAIENADGEWLTRRDLAVRIGRPTRLNPYDVQVLDDLAAQGLIEMSEKVTGTVRKEYVYRTRTRDE